MTNQRIIFNSNQKVLLYVTEDNNISKTYIAFQDIDSCDISETIAENVVGKEFAMDTELFINTSDSNAFDCNYEWYLLEWAIVTDENYQMHLVTSDFIGNVPGR